MTKFTPDQIRSLQAKIDALAKKEGRSSMQTLTLFLLERATARLLADLFLHKNITFKGGYVGLRVYSSPRFTTDLDAVLSGEFNEQI